MTSQLEKAQQFQTLHQSGCFVIPNPWDVGSAKLMQGLGYKALASTSAGFARSTGVNDYDLTRDQVIAHVAELAAATDLPLSADLENGFGDSPEACFDTIQRGAAAGLVGGSIEDFSGKPGEQYDIGLAKDRVTAAVEAAQACSFPFMLTARAENFFTGTPELSDTIERLQAYQDAGADVLYAPGLKTLADISSVLAAVDRPINVLLGPMSKLQPVSVLAEMGVRRISIGSIFANLAMDAVIKASRNLQTDGSFEFMDDLASSSEITRLMFGK